MRQVGVEGVERTATHELRLFVQQEFGDRIEQVAARAKRLFMRRAYDSADSVRRRVADHAREIFLRFPAQMLGELRDGRREFGIAFYFTCFITAA